MIAKNALTATIIAKALQHIDVSTVALSKKYLSSIPPTQRYSGRDILHRIALDLLLDRIKVCREPAYGVLMGFYKGVTILNTVKYGLEADAKIIRKNESCDSDITSHVKTLFLELVPKIPVFIVDLSLWELHHQKELPSLIKQLVVTINTVRKALTDLHIVLSSAPRDVVSKVNELIPNACPSYSSREIYEYIDLSRTVLLDPYAEESLTENDVRSYDFFIIGGIIDRLFPRPYASYMLYKMLSLDIARKGIRLRGSAVGVPSEINKIIDIVLTVRLEGIELEKAIIANMGVDDKIARILHEIEKLKKSREKLSVDYVRELMAVYELDDKYLPRILSRISLGGI